jgi:hypothetical protein
MDEWSMLFCHLNIKVPKVNKYHMFKYKFLCVVSIVRPKQVLCYIFSEKSFQYCFINKVKWKNDGLFLQEMGFLSIVSVN